MKYHFMSGGELDYSQALTAVDSSGTGWIPPPPSEIAEDYADGSDTRFLHTMGPVTLSPGDSLVAAWAWVVAPRWHTHPDHFVATFDAAAPETYLDGLGMANLDTALAQMKLLWDSGFERARVGAPRDLTITGWDDHEAWLNWLPRHTERLQSYEILRSLDPQLFLDPPIVTLSPNESSYTDLGLARENTYYYTIRSVSRDGRPGPLAPPVDVLPDRPMSPLRLAAQRGNASITLSWDPPGESDVVAHRIYRRNESDIWSLIEETSELQSYTDLTAQNAVVYEYKVGAVSALGNESFPSEPILGLAFAFDGLPLVLDHTPSDPSALSDKDSVRAVWERILGVAAAIYRDADPVMVEPFGLEVFNNHPALIAVADGRFALRSGTQDQLSLYAYTGGAAILSGRDLFNDEPVAEGTISFGPDDFPHDNLGITAAYYPRVLLSNPTRMNAEFTGARATRTDWPDLKVDSTRTDWGLNPILTSTEGAVPFVGYFEVDPEQTEVLYTFVSNQGHASPLHGKPVAVVSRNPESPVAAFAFPLSYMHEASVKPVLMNLLRELGWRSTRAGDVDGDGQVGLSDADAIIDYLYRGQTLFLPENGNIAGSDCDINIIDAMSLLAFARYGAPIPVHQCASITATGRQ
jgi:hypothetical protein